VYGTPQSSLDEAYHEARRAGGVEYGVGDQFVDEQRRDV
jgi:hypothetical protein